MSAETILNATLLAAGPVTSIVGSGAAARIYPDVVPQEVDTPCVAFSRIGTETVGTLSAALVTQKAVIECWCMGNSRAAAEALASSVVAAASAAWFILTSRRSEFDAEAELWASVLIFEYWES